MPASWLFVHGTGVRAANYAATLETIKTTVPWETLSVVAIIYLLMIPASVASYARVKRRRAAAAAPRPSVPTQTG